MSRKHKDRNRSPQHVVARLDGAPGGLEPDCPICALLAAQGQEVLGFDLDTMDLAPERVAPMGPTTEITVNADAAVAPFLGGTTTTLAVPEGMLVGELLLAVRFVIPELAKAFGEGGLALQVDGHPLGWAAPVPRRVTLVATARQARS